MTDENGNDMSHPLYGGNKIPDSYLAEHRRQYGPQREPLPADMAALPFWIKQFAEMV